MYACQDMRTRAIQYLLDKQNEQTTIS